MLLNTKNNAVDEKHEHKTSMKTMISATEQSTMTTAYFDITELLAFLKTSPIVTGIQRVQVEAILAGVGDRDAQRPTKCIFLTPIGFGVHYPTVCLHS